MRVVYLNAIARIGGGEMSLLDMMTSVAEAMPGIERHLIVTASEGPLIERSEALGVRVHRLPMPNLMAGLGVSGLKGPNRIGLAIGLAARGLPAGVMTYGFARSLRRTLREIGPDLVHTNDIKSHLLGSLTTSRSVPVVWHVRDFLSGRALIGRAFRWAARRAAGAIAISEAVGRDARTVLPGLPIHVVYNAIDVDHFRPGPGDGPRFDALAGLPPAEPGTIRVGLVAAYARWKGQDLLLKAAAKILAERPGCPVRFYIVGGAIYKTKGSQFSEEELRGLASGIPGLSASVGFVPFQDDPADAFRAFDVVVHASTRPEPFGRTIVEGMACGRPVIVSAAGGAAELFTDGEDAVGFPPGDVDALASAILGLIDDPARRARIAEAARATALRRFSRDRLGREVADVYRLVKAGG